MRLTPDDNARVCPFCDKSNLKVKVILDALQDDDNYLCAYVYCTDCGAEGPKFYTLMGDEIDLAEVTHKAVELWNNRDSVK